MDVFLKKHRDVSSRTIATAKVEISVTLVIGSFQPLHDFAMNPNIGAMGVQCVQVIKLRIVELKSTTLINIICFTG